MRLPPPSRIPLEVRTRWYIARHVRTVRAALADPNLLAAVRAGDALPAGYGKRLDERVVEFPWLLSMAPSGRVLDAGSTLNHAHVLDAFLPSLDALHIATLEPELAAFPQRRISYTFCDLRDLPYRDDLFDTIVSSSTLEHVGMDNERYGVSVARAADPDAELDQALQELRRVLRPRGRMLVTVPYGRAEDRGWRRQFDRAGVEGIVRSVGASTAQIAVFAYGAGGWQPSDLDAAAQARFRDDERDSEADGAAAARAVACLALSDMS
jgi:SAM-dependent methyltransferase